MAKRILVLGSGGREHAICWHLNLKGYQVDASPGSDAINQFADCWTFDSYEGLLRNIKEKSIGLVIVGPEAFLADGIADYLEDRGVSCFGPTQKAAQLEADKAFAKKFCTDFQIRTPKSVTVKFEHQIKEALEQFKAPYVVKASGLAAGKGVWLGENIDEAIEVGKAFLKNHYSLVIEEFVEGQELSCFYMIDGQNQIYLGACQDHKRLLDKDQGPNTGGMGAYSPPPLLTSGLKDRIHKEVLERVLLGLKERNLSYKGFLFLGLMISGKDIHLIEFNCRLGDPETQALMMRLQTPLPELIDSLAQSSSRSAQLKDEFSLSVVLSAEGYPLEAKKGFQIPLLQKVPEDLQVFHAGTKKEGKSWVANGGRLFSLNATGSELKDCQQKIYSFLEDCAQKDFLHFRKDIGAKALQS